MDVTGGNGAKAALIIIIGLEVIIFSVGFTLGALIFLQN